MPAAYKFVPITMVVIGSFAVYFHYFHLDWPLYSLLGCIYSLRTSTARATWRPIDTVSENAFLVADISIFHSNMQKFLSFSGIDYFRNIEALSCFPKDGHPISLTYVTTCMHSQWRISRFVDICITTIMLFHR